MGKQVLFTYSNHTVLLEIPNTTCINEHAYRLLDQWQLPVFLFSKLQEALRLFFNEQIQIVADETTQLAVQSLIEGQCEIQPLLDHWFNLVQECKTYIQHLERPSDEHIFSNAFQNVLHTGNNYEILLQLEYIYQNEIEVLLKQRDKEMQELDKEHHREMHDVVNEPTNKYPDVYVRNLAQKHMEEKQSLEAKWNSNISSAKDRQKQQFKECVMQLHEESLVSNSLQNSNGSKMHARISAAPPSPLSVVIAVPDTTLHERRLETSYTVQLGAQLKSMYNLRLIRCDALDYCRLRTQKKENKILLEPQRLQTLMSLYTSSLCGLILLVPKRIRLSTGDIKEEFASVCERSTDFHFPSLEQQMSSIEEDCVKKANSDRLNASASLDSNSIASKHSDTSSEESNLCSVGDFYVTRHSNLSEVHVVYHLVVNDSSLRSSTEITSRHPALFGLRNILKECCKHDVTTLTLPLLLTHDMTEEMTIPWVMKRTELVLKCLKGFMMEMGTWGTNRCSTIQLVVPKNLLNQTFFQLADHVSTIFREPKTVMLQF
ncbi:unnamed protein product [Rotaria socialis]|uniref:Uncharacterized protein n=1 Tax=Rotaria socialis TaxID=392032 RepID=A0A819A1E7_9BILA|nr:unnamed protein product [Rotaria socialis]CAF4454818.1 unnamed protein product [Rotaria socialis]